MTECMLGEDQANDAEQAQQTGHGTQNRQGDMLSRRFKSQVFSHFLKGGFDRPAGGEPTDDLRRLQRRVGRVEVFVPMRALHVMDERPADRHQPFAGLVPLSGPADQFDTPICSAVPSDRRRTAPRG